MSAWPPSNVSRETLERLSIFHALLLKWSPKINLVARASLADAPTRHFADSAQLVKLIPSKGIWMDMGSGAGFPAMVLAIIASETSPGASFTLIESDRRKCEFLRTVARETCTSVEVHASRVEDLAARHARVISARALAPLDRLFDLAKPSVTAETLLVFPKGVAHTDEVERARLRWSFDLEILPSVTDANAAILLCRNLDRV